MRNHPRASATVRVAAATALVTTVLLAPSAALLRAAAASGSPATVSADALPTVQVDGVVWAQVTVGNTVYATGRFAYARPAGTPATSSSRVARANLLAYDIRTGMLITSFAHTLDGQGLALSASPDGKRLYVGGEFTHVDGAARGRLAAFDVKSGALVSTFAPAVNGSVLALAATNSLVYAGGAFSAVDGSVRRHLAGYKASGALTGWKPATDGSVTALVVTPDARGVVVGGRFAGVNGVSHVGIDRVDAVTGTDDGWPADFPIQTGSHDAGVTSLATDGTSVFGSSYSFNSSGNFEGRFSTDQTGRLRWMNSCHGDSYSVFPIDGVLYSASHEHDCAEIGGFPQPVPVVGKGPWQRVEAETTAATGVLLHPIYTTGGPNGPYYQDFAGQPSATQLNWYPQLVSGLVTGQGQAAWSVTGNASYVSFGGEFPAVNGVAQQGLVRFAVRSLAPNRSGPQAAPSPLIASTAAGARVAWRTSWDADDDTLSYAVYRDGALVTTRSATSTFWDRPALGYLDTAAKSGTTHTWQIRVADPSGNTVTGPAVTVAVTAPIARPYADTVLTDGATTYWPSTESAGSVLHDAAGDTDLTTGSGVTLAQPGHSGLPGNDPATAAGYSGTTESTALSPANLSGAASTYTIEAWFQTSSTSGGLIVGDGLYPSGDSYLVDRALFVNPAGNLVFGTRDGAGTRTLSTHTTYADALWHLADVTVDASGTTLYVDGLPLATDVAAVGIATFDGYWRVGADSLVCYGQANGLFTGAIADIAAYPTALAAGTVLNHFLRGRGLI